MRPLPAIRLPFPACALAVLLAAAVLAAGPPPKQAKKPAAATEAPAPQTPPKPQGQDSTEQAGYRIEQPGTITFTVGMVIKGKIEKPQVMIFLPKEKTMYREQKFSHSFAEDLGEPLPFTPILE
jgi:hypothetical protein